MKNTKKIHELTIKSGINRVENMLDTYCEADYKKYRKFLGKLKTLVNKCADGHGIGKY